MRKSDKNPLEIEWTRSRAEIEDRISEALDSLIPEVLADAIAGGMPEAEAKRQMHALESFLAWVLRSLPPRKGRGGLTLAARACERLLSRHPERSAAKRGRPRDWPDAAITEFRDRVHARIEASLAKHDPLSQRAAILLEITSHYESHRRPLARHRAKDDLEKVRKRVERLSK